VDLIVAGSVFTHLRPERVASELHLLTQALKPGGSLVVTLHDFAPQTSVHALTEESALPELEDQLSASDYASVHFAEADWNQRVPRGFTCARIPERFGGTQQILVLKRAEPEA
jgi:hypothetical protein